MTKTFGQFVDADVRLGLVQILIKWFGVLKLSVENLGNLVLGGNSPQLIILVALVLLWLFWRMQTEGLGGKKLLGLWVGVFVLAFGVYRGPVPPYYLLLQLPALMVLVVELVGKRVKRNAYVWLGLYLLWGVWVSGASILKPNSGLSLGNQVSVAAFVNTQLDTGVVNGVVYDTELARDIGFRYLIDEPVDTTAPILHVAYPAGDGTKSWMRLGDISVWFDPRGTIPNTKYLELDELLISSPLDVQLLADGYGAREFNTPKAFRVMKDSEPAGMLLLLHKSDQENEYEEWLGLQRTFEQSTKQEDGWLWKMVDDELVGISHYQDYMMIYISERNIEIDHKEVMMSLGFSNGDPNAL